MEVRHFYTKVAGVTFLNPDGKSRQKIIKKCRLGEELRLIPEPTNPHDPNAVAIYRQNNSQIGYLSADLASEIKRKLDSDWCITSFVTRLTGGGRRSRGVNIAIILGPPGVSQKQMKRASKQIEIGSANNLDEENEDAVEGLDTESSPGCSYLLGGMIIIIFLYFMVKIFFRVN